jgi:hypothetical protein
MDAIKFPPLDPAVFAAKLARWEKREHTPKSKRTSDYGRVFAEQNVAAFEEVVSRRKAAKAQQRREYLSAFRVR